MCCARNMVRLRDCDIRGLIMKEGLRATGVNGYNTRTRVGGGTSFIFTESTTQSVTQLRWDSQHNERTMRRLPTRKGCTPRQSCSGAICMH